MSLKLKSDGKSIVGINIPKAEQHYGAKFVMDTCVKDSHGNWVGPVALFYQPVAHIDSGSHYFALRVRRGDAKDVTVMIMNGQTAADHVYEGLVLNDEVYHSRHRHDFRPVGPDYIDGGLDYTRLLGLTLPIVKFAIVDGEPVFEAILQSNDMAGRFPDRYPASDAGEKHFMDEMFDRYDQANSGAFWK